MLTSEQLVKIAGVVNHICNDTWDNRTWDYGYAGELDPPSWVVTRTIKRKVDELFNSTAFQKEMEVSK